MQEERGRLRHETQRTNSLICSKQDRESWTIVRPFARMFFEERSECQRRDLEAARVKQRLRLVCVIIAFYVKVCVSSCYERGKSPCFPAFDSFSCFPHLFSPSLVLVLVAHYPRRRRRRRCCCSETREQRLQITIQTGNKRTADASSLLLHDVPRVTAEPRICS